MPEDTDARELRLDLSGLREEHLHRGRPWSRRTATVALVGVVAAAVVGVVVAVALDHPGVAVRALVLATVWGVASTAIERRWPPRTVLRPEELDVRDHGVFRDRYGWSWVAEVRCRPTRRPPGVAVLRDGRRLRLVGVSAADVDRLARALDRARAAGPTARP